MVSLKTVKKFYVFLIFLCPFIVHPKPNHALIYPEETFREKWDNGCADWKILSPMVSGISVHTERKEGQFRIYASAKLMVQSGETLDEVFNRANTILTDGSKYPEWVMPGINQDPEGGTYFVSLESAKAHQHQYPNQYAIVGLYALNLLWFKQSGETSILLKSETSSLPNCPEVFEHSTSQTFSKVTYRMIPKKGILDYMIGEAYVSKAKEHVNLNLRAVIKPDSILYEVISESLIRVQVNHRARRIFENFINTYQQGAESKVALPK